MGHSLKEYLEKQSTETLTILSEHYSKAKMHDEYELSLKLIKEIIDKRKEKAPS